jgi:hypothetical protein
VMNFLRFMVLSLFISDTNVRQSRNNTWRAL